MARREITEEEFQAKKAHLEAMDESLQKGLASGLVTPKQALGAMALEVAEILTDLEED